MEMPTRKALSSRLLLFVLSLVLLATSLVTTFPREAEAAPCCTWKATTTYYYDAARTQYAGRCVDDMCAETYICTGDQTEYSRVTLSCCQVCPP